MIYEGKAKKVFKTDDPKAYVVQYKDDATAFNGVKKGTIRDKGIVNNEMSALLFRALEKAGVKTHFLEKLSDREMLVRAVEIVPVEVIVRNVAAGSLAKRLGLEEGTALAHTVIEFCYKSDELGDPMINDDHVTVLGLADADEIATLRKLATSVNDLLEGFFADRGVTLVDFKLEFGRYEGEIILADEISPDTCRLWDKETGKKLDKDVFRRDLGDPEAVYQEILGRIK